MKKISVIFFLLCLISIFIYNIFKKENIDVLYLGDSEYYYEYVSDIKKYKISKYSYDSVVYKNITNDIKDNSFKIIKGKNLYLTQAISNSDIIILSANNFEYKNKCKKIDRIINEYDIVINRDVNSLINVISRISNSKIIVIGNSCENHIQNLKLYNGYYLNFENIEDLDKIISKIANN